ncbi:hypothetical protein Taro_004979 [Colocasia esculenta]|uniref:Putative plant transposon protein domain-containing protein n=1 Tax=Colocasia esculenta TaxID=4460 RepID=A0A843TT82_COLES|nr:hypothetical protein [Colocasia esculenta]
MDRLGWTKMATFSEVSYPDLVKAFYVCLKTKEDGTLTSMVKGTQSRVTRELLPSIFGVTTSGHSGVHTVDIQAKGLGIVGPEYKFKDGKLDINQLNAFNHLLHFIVCQILVPRSATFSTRTKADSDLMFWTIQNQEINLAKIIIERMKFASAHVWDKKSKLNVSLPYAYLLTKVFQHYGISVVGDVSEKMGQAIRSRNLRKSGFLVVNGVWSKTFVAEGEAIIGEAQEVQEEVGEAAVAATVQMVQEESPVAAPATIPAEESRAVVLSIPDQQEHIPSVQKEPEATAADVQVNAIASRIEDLLPEQIEPVGQYSEVVPPSSRVASVLRDVLDSIQSNLGGPVISDDQATEAVALGHTDEIIMEKAPSQEEQEDAHENVQVDDTPIQGEQGVEKEAAPQGEHTESVPMNIEENVESVERSERASSKRKRIAHKKPKKKQLKVNLKPIIKRLNEQGKSLTSLQSDIQSIIISQTSATNEIGALSTEVHNLRDDFKMFKQLCRWMKGEFDSVKKLISSRVQSSSAPPAHSPVEPVSSSGPSENEVERPSGPLIVEDVHVGNPSVAKLSEDPAGPSGPAIVDPVPAVESRPSGPPEEESGPSGPMESESELHRAEEEAVALAPPAPSPIQTPAPPSPPSSSTTPPAPQPFKQPLPRAISSPTPFPSHTSSSSASTNFIPPPPPFIEVPSASSSVGASSSSGPSSSGPADIPMFNNYQYINHLHEIQLGQFKQAIQALGSAAAHTEAIQVDFSSLQVSNSVFLPPLHSLVMESSVGSIIFERLARVMGRIHVQKGSVVAFNRFLFREYHLGHVSAEILAPLLSECERFSPADWARFYPLSAQQLSDLNESQAREGKPPLSAATFLDMNSIHLVNDPFQTWVEQYKVYVAMRLGLKQKQIFYPASMDQFHACANFWKISHFKTSFPRDQYADFLDEQLVLHHKRMAPTMGPSYSLAPGIFRLYFEQQEDKAWEVISHYTSLLSPAFYLPVPPQA